ncbi:D-alanyl-D-alanine carboxypeptidase [Candidatus Uhrbacteria bacterium]|jgi:D-alanyl-D-alanine carboxypeptidase|nr:D-alanyl-D-alanine carboxypeptidase [Candidatus Uhrbacteria bacterium]
MKLRSVINVLLILTLAQILPGISDSNRSTQDIIKHAVAEVELPHAGQRGPQKTNPDSLGILTDAPSVVIRDVNSGVELMSRGADIKRPIASITKLMTAMVLLDEYDWDWGDEATVLESDVREGGRWYYRFNDSLTMDDLFTAMIVASGNNETLALVREVGESETSFVQKMNDKARVLGMHDTTFADPIGLAPEMRSTADDVMVLLHEALKREEILSRTHQTHVMTTSGNGNQYKIASTNKLFSSLLDEDPYTIVGGKTGSLIEAGYCLTTRVERDGHVLDVTVLGASEPDARFTDVQALVSWAFDVYSWGDEDEAAVI